VVIMTGPSGDEVARLTVRVLPDSSGFGQKLKADLAKVKAELRVPVVFDLDTAGLRAKLAALRLPAIHVPVDIDEPNVPPTIPVRADTDAADREVDAFVAKTDAKQAKVKVNADVDRAAIDRIVNNLKLKAKVDIDVDHFNTQLARAVAATERVGVVKIKADLDRSTFTRATNAIRSGLESLVGVGSRIGGVLSSVGSIGGAAADQVRAGFEGVSGVLPGLLRVGTAIAQMSVYAAAAAIGGATLTAAWGGVSTAIAAVPAALALIGGPLAAAKVGMDGIKKAAQTLRPEFDKLKASVSATFEKGLVPVFNQLKSVFPTLDAGLNKIASSMVTVAGGLANFVTSAQGVSLIQTLFDNVGQAVLDIKPGLIAAADGMLRLAGNQAALSALANTVNEVGTAIQNISNNANLDAAFRGLEGVLQSLTRGFQDLVNNGIELFAAAAPGVQRVIDSLTGFFNDFDWASLGSSVSGVFDGIASALDRVDAGTISEIEQAFARLADTFQSEEFQGQLDNMIAGIPAAVNQLNGLVQVFGQVGSAVSTAIQIYDNFDQKFKAATESISQAANDLGNKIFGPEFRQKFGDWAKGVNDSINDWLGVKTPETIKQGMEKSGAEAEAGGQKIAAGVVNPLQTLGAQVSGAVGPIPGTLESQLWAPMVGGAQNAGAGIPPAIMVPLAGIPGLLPSAVGSVPSTLQQLLMPMGPAAAAAAAPVPGAVVGPLTPLPAEVGSTLAPVPGALRAILGQMAPQAGAAAAQVPPATLGPLTPLPGQVGALGAQVPTSLSAALLPMAAAAAGAIAPVPTSLLGPLTPLPGQVQGVGGQIVAGFGSGLTPMSSTLQQQLGLLPPVATEGMAGVQGAVTTGLETLPPAVTMQMTQVQSAFSTGLAAISTGVTALFGPQLTAAVTTAMTGVTTAVTTGLAAANTAAQTGLQTLITSMQTSTQPLVTNITTTMSQFVQALQAGVQQSVQASQQGAQQIVQAFDPLPAAMAQVGTNAMNALAAAIAAGQSAVINAVAQVVAAAIAAANSALQIASPSRVFGHMGDMTVLGYVNQLLAGRKAVASAADKMMSSAISAGESASAALGLGDASNGFGASFQASIAASGQIGSDGAAAPLIGSLTINAGGSASARDIGDEVMFRLRTARRGVHSGR
jgi:hypothetical protein